MWQMLLLQRRKSTSSSSHEAWTNIFPRGAPQDLARGPTPGREIGLTAVPVESSNKHDPTSPSNEDPQIGQLRG
jgi:hypothetical protein